MKTQPHFHTHINTVTIHSEATAAAVCPAAVPLYLFMHQHFFQVHDLWHLVKNPATNSLEGLWWLKVGVCHFTSMIERKKIHRMGTNAGDKWGVCANFETATPGFSEALLKRQLLQECQPASKLHTPQECFKFTTLFRAVRKAIHTEWRLSCQGSHGMSSI